MLTVFQCIILIYMFCILSEAQPLNSKISTSWNFADSSVFEFSRGFHWNVHSADSEFRIAISIDDAIFGKSMDLTVQRIVRDTKCPFSTCKYCKGTGVITSKTKTPLVDQVLHTPCPLCKGVKLSSEGGCVPYKQITEVVPIRIPEGVRPGYQIMIHQKGNEVQMPGSDHNVTTGTLQVTIAEVSTGGLNVTASGITMTIEMTPMEAMNGFKVEKEYINKTKIVVDRTNKTTLPDSEIVIRGKGLPKFNSARSNNQDTPEALIIERDDLLLRFVFSKDPDDVPYVFDPETMKLEDYNKEFDEREARKKKNRVLKAFLKKMKILADKREAEKKEAEAEREDSYYYDEL